MSSDFSKLIFIPEHFAISRTVFPADLAMFAFNFDRFLSEFRDTCQNMQQYIQNFKRKIDKSCATFPEISELIIAETTT